MANANHLEQLLQGVDAWNAWRQKEPALAPDLSGANLRGANLGRSNLSRTDLSAAKLMETNLAGANLSGANLGRANLSGANLSAVTTSFGSADLSGADLAEANVGKANLTDANLSGANLNRANLREAKLMWANLSASHLIGSDLSKANLTGANLSRANLSGAELIEANLSKANLQEARLGRANLSAANLTATLLVETDLANADLTGCTVYGISAWRLKLSEGTKQHDLVITPEDEPKVAADGLDVAQFLYLVLDSEKLRRTIDSITSKLVLILGRFPPERKAVLDAMRERLRQPDLGYVPVAVDFEQPRTQTAVEAVMMLARMARFVIADLSDAKSVLPELQSIVAGNPMLPVQLLTIAAQREPGMFDFIERFPSVLRTYRYDDLAQLTADFDTLVGACRLKSWG